MPTVFICHASEDKPVVEPIQLALVNAGLTVFYDSQSLPSGGDYQGRIEAAIADCDVFVFIASPASTAAGRFTLSELKFARGRWASPIDRVLPVAIGNVSPAALPPYLQAITIFTASGNLAAEVRAEVEAMLRRQKAKGRKRLVPVAALAVVALAAGGAGWKFMQPPPSPVPVDQQIAGNDPRTQSPTRPVPASAPASSHEPVPKVPEPQASPPASAPTVAAEAPPPPASKPTLQVPLRPVATPAIQVQRLPPAPAPGPKYTNVWQEAQVLLKVRGYNLPRTDGIPGPSSVNALKAFQRKNNLEATGEPDDATMQTLRRLAEERKAGKS